MKNKMLEQYRNELDNVDKEIINLLAKRFEIVKQIGKYKKENNIWILQKWRWEEVLKSRKQIAKNLWINENLIESIWNLIHQEALKLEK